MANVVDARQGARDRPGIGEVERDVLALGMEPGGDVGAARLVAPGDHHSVPFFEAQRGEVPAQSGRASDDYRCGSLHTRRVQ